MPGTKPEPVTAGLHEQYQRYDGLIQGYFRFLSEGGGTGSGSGRLVGRRKRTKAGDRARLLDERGYDEAVARLK